MSQNAPADREHWARVAKQWIAWARSPEHDAYWSYRNSLLAFTGTGTGKALDVGCGEGRVSRDLRTLGYHVTATDAVAEMVDAARQADSADAYAVSDAATLGFDDSTFDLVVAYNVLMDVEDVPGSVKEMRRVMRPDGTLLISLVHPFRDRGSFAGSEPDAPFVVPGTYYGRERFEGSEERGGLTMDFAGWSQPLQDYMAALQAAGLAITALLEPQPDAELQAALQQWSRIPLFLWLKARPLAP
ncbi:class I SAM-dependent methyltransferase [Phyllobacterium sp. 22229]|uniref:class I SAM-dependent methyltransferase n=1 Tax=Phyllobacterium sp. 22229 TaxID=3453895 RepID=UPI003F869A81